MNASDSARLVIAEAPRIRIRHKTRADAADDFRWRRDPELQRFNAEPAIEATFEEFLIQFELDRTFGHDRRAMFSVESRADGEHIGNVMYYNADRRSGTVEFGMTLADEANRGHGLGREVVAAFLRYLFSEHPYRCVILHTLAWNERAQRSFQAAGFEPAGTHQRHGEAFTRMEARREWWLLRAAEGRYDFAAPSSRTD